MPINKEYLADIYNFCNQHNIFLYNISESKNYSTPKFDYNFYCPSKELKYKVHIGYCTSEGSSNELSLSIESETFNHKGEKHVYYASRTYEPSMIGKSIDYINEIGLQPLKNLQQQLSLF